MTPFSELVGRTLISVTTQHECNDPTEPITEIQFLTDDHVRFRLFHTQDCCESVSVESIVGDLADLIGTPILLASEASNTDREERSGDTSTWTFYKLGTLKGYVDIRWLGTSNGYYSESVDFERMTSDAVLS